MDTQPQPQNSPVSAEQAAVSGSENLPTPGTSLEQAPGLQASPSPAVLPASASVAPKLTPNDVAAAIAAVPGPSPTTPAPVMAADVDVIEPEWVAKAESVVAEHQGDPYGEEEAIEKLQQDYLQKRYGHNVADAGQGSKEA